MDLVRTESIGARPALKLHCSGVCGQSAREQRPKQLFFLLVIQVNAQVASAFHVTVVPQENTKQGLQQVALTVLTVLLERPRLPARSILQNVMRLVIQVNGIAKGHVSIVTQENTNQVMECHGVIVCHVHLGAPRFPARRPLQNVSASRAMRWVVLTAYQIKLRGPMAAIAVLIMKRITCVQGSGTMIPWDMAPPITIAVRVAVEFWKAPTHVSSVNMASTEPTACPTTRASPAPTCCQTRGRASTIRSASAVRPTPWLRPATTHHLSASSARQVSTKLCKATSLAPCARCNSRPRSTQAGIMSGTASAQKATLPRARRARRRVWPVSRANTNRAK